MHERFKQQEILPIETYPGSQDQMQEDIVYEEKLYKGLRFYLQKKINGLTYSIYIVKHIGSKEWTIHMGTLEHHEALTEPGGAIFTIFRARKSLIDTVNNREYIVDRVKSEAGKTSYTVDEAEYCRQVLAALFINDEFVEDGFDESAREKIRKERGLSHLTIEGVINSKDPITLYQSVFHKEFPKKWSQEDAQEMRINLYRTMAEQMGWGTEKTNGKYEIIFTIPDPTAA